VNITNWQDLKALRRGEYDGLLLDLHPRNTGSILYKRNNGDELVFILGGYLLIMHEKEKYTSWVLVKTLSDVWNSWMDKILPSDAKEPLLTRPQHPITHKEQEVLGELIDHLKNMYCQITNDELEALIKSLETPEVDIKQLRDQYEAALEQAKIEKMEAERASRYAKNSGRRARIIAYQARIFVVDLDGFVLQELRLSLPGLDKRRFLEIVENNGGLPARFYNNGFVWYYPDPFRGKIKFATAYIPDQSVELPANIKRKYGLLIKRKDTQEDKDLEVKYEGARTGSTPLFFLMACPPKIIDGKFGYGIEKEDVNTYLLNFPGSTDLRDWVILSGTLCYRCGGLNQNFTADASTSRSSSRLRIIKTLDFKILTSDKDSSQRARVLSSLSRAFEFAKHSAIRENVLLVLGEEGFVFERTDGVLVLSHEDIEVRYHNGIHIPQKAFLDWTANFARVQLEVKNDIGINIVRELFEEAAMGKTHWIKRYRQNPIVFLAQHCEVK
jgi:hypothetical protein